MSNMEPEKPIEIRTKPVKSSILVLFCLVAVVSAVTETYLWQHQKVDSLNRQVTSLQNEAQTIRPNVAKQSQVKFIRTVGFPYDLKNTIVTTNLGVPAHVEAVQIRSSNNRGSEQIFTDKFNDEMARYVLNYPQFPTNSNEISILAISPSWLSSSNERETFLGYGSATGIEPQVNLQSPASKAQYVHGLRALTQTCTKDPAKGFQTKDKTFSICYKVSPDKYGGPSVLLLSGYAEVQGEPLILTGLLFLDDHYNVLNSSTSGFHLQSTSDATKEFINAIAQTTVTSGARTK